MQGLTAATYVAASDGLATTLGGLLIPVAALVLVIAGFIRLSRAPKASGVAMVAVGAVILVVSLPFTLGPFIKESGAPTKSDGLAVGQCTTDTAVTSGSLEFEPMDCADPDAVMELVSTSDTNTCPDGEPPNSSLYASVSDNETAYCFIPNLKQGNCYAINTTGQQSLKVDDCANLSPRVVKRVDGSVDPSVCSASTTAVVFPEPERVYCFEGL